MARTRVLLVLVAVQLALSGCSAFFDFNAFSSLDKASAPNPSRYQGAGGLANLQTDLSSPSVVEALKNDPATVATVLTNLDSAYHVTTTPPTTPDQQTAAILYAELALQSTSGDVLVNNIADTVVNNPSGNLQSVLSSIVPADVAGNLTKFTAMVDNLLQAEAVYRNLGTSLDPNNPPPGMNMGDVAQKAAVALMMDSMLGAVETQKGLSQSQSVDQMFALINNQTNSVADVNVPDPFTGITTDPTLKWLKNIFDAAGTPYPA